MWVGNNFVKMILFIFNVMINEKIFSYDSFLFFELVIRIVIYIWW